MDDTHSITKQTRTKCEAAMMVFSVKCHALCGLIEKLKLTVEWISDRDQRVSQRRRVQRLTMLFIYITAIILVSNNVLPLCSIFRTGINFGTKRNLVWPLTTHLSERQWRTNLRISALQSRTRRKINRRLLWANSGLRNTPNKRFYTKSLWRHLRRFDIHNLKRV